jgi:methyltransferase (TIGR00027 family)
MAGPSRTAQYVALYRALETVEARRPPLFRDPYARRFLSPGLRALIGVARTGTLQDWIARYADRRAPGARTSAIARTVFIDACVERAAAAGVEQYVLLGAGFDCRAHRMSVLAGRRVFEVDREATQATKRARVPSSSVRYVPTDFVTEDPFARLLAEGWDRTAPTLFIWEGVTNYLTEAAVKKVLEEVGRTAPGSTIVFTYLHRGVLDGSAEFPGSSRMVENVRALGEPWIFGIAPDEVAAFVADAGLVLEENLGADQYRARCLPSWEDSGGYAFYRIARAKVA